MHDYESPTELLAELGQHLNKRLPTANPLLTRHLTELEAMRFRLAEAVADWHQKVAEHKNRMLHPKDKDMTELDRNVMLDAHVAVVRRDYEFLLQLQHLVEQRLELGKILLTLL